MKIIELVAPDREFCEIPKECPDVSWVVRSVLSGSGVQHEAVTVEAFRKMRPADFKGLVGSIVENMREQALINAVKCWAAEFRKWLDTTEASHAA